MPLQVSKKTILKASSLKRKIREAVLKSTFKKDINKLSLFGSYAYGKPTPNNRRFKSSVIDNDCLLEVVHSDRLLIPTFSKQGVATPCFEITLIT